VASRRVRDSERAQRERGGDRPVPDEVQLEQAPTPQPEHEEPRLADAGVSDLSARDWFAVLRRAGKKMLADNMMMIAQALAYSSFLAIPSVLLLAVGVFTLLAGPSAVTSLVSHLGTVLPGQATHLLQGSLSRLNSNQSSSLVMTIVGGVLALWSTTGAMTSYMTALNLAYDRSDSRNFVKKRAIAVAMVACIGAAFLLVAVLLIFGPAVERYVGDALGIQTFLKYIWWAAQWPILIAGLLTAFATLLYLGPDVEHPRWRFLTVGSAIAAAIWLCASGAFAYYTAHFGSYNKTWGSIAAVIIMLTWLWLTGLALLFGAEVNAEAERSRELRQGEPAEHNVQLPAQG
jgi:membrane protein